MNKKILFLVNGLGLGNSIRCYSIIERLKRHNNEITVITSGNGEWFFKKKKEINNLYFNDPIYYGSNNNKISVSKTLINLNNIFNTIKNNSKKLIDIINNIKPDVIVTDSVYIFPSVKKLSIPIIAINNADLTVDYFKKFKDRPKSIYAQYYFVESMDYLYHKIIPDIVISPCFLTEDINNIYNKNKIQRVGPIVRQGIKKRNKRKINRGAIMLSGSTFGVEINLKNEKQLYDLDIIGRNPPRNWQEKSGIKFHGKIFNNIELINNIDFCVVNAGYSALSELYWAKIPMIVVPIQNHAEQWTNAKQIEMSGCGIMSTQDNYEKLIAEMANNIEKYENNYDNSNIIDDGAEESARIILDV